MDHYVNIKSQEPEGLLHIINEDIANIMFRLHENCKMLNQTHADCNIQTECSLNQDCFRFSGILENDSTLLDLILGYPFLYQNLIKIFNKLSYKLRKLIASFGEFKSKSETEIKFLAKMKIDQASSSAGFQFDRKGAANHVLGNYEEAISCFDQAINLLGERANIVFRRGEAKYKLELFKEATADFNLAIELNEQARDKDRLEEEELGTVNLRLGNYQKAEADFLKVIALNPNHPDANCRLGEIYSHRIDNREDLEKAIAFFEKAILINENHKEARLELAISLFRISTLIGGDTVLQFLKSARIETQKAKDCDQNSHKAVRYYSEKSLDQLKWLIEETEINGFLLPHAKALRLSRLYQLNGKVLKMLGDNTFSSSETKDTSKIREKTITELECCLDLPLIKFEVGELLNSIINFKRLSVENQKLKAGIIANSFNKLIAKTQKHRKKRERRFIATAASNFFASIGSFKTASHFVLKLQTDEQKDGTRDTFEYCEALKKRHDALKVEMHKSKLNFDTLLYYLEAEKYFEKAALVHPTSSSIFLAAIVCLSICDLVPKLREKFLQKASDHTETGLELDQENRKLINLKKDIESLKMRN